MNASCYNTWMLNLSCSISELGVKLANAQSYNTKKQSCLKEDLIISTFMFAIIQCYCFYTEAELLADTTLDGGDKSESVSDEDIIIILNKIKSLVDECQC